MRLEWEWLAASVRACGPISYARICSCSFSVRRRIPAPAQELAVLGVGIFERRDLGHQLRSQLGGAVVVCRRHSDIVLTAILKEDQMVADMIVVLSQMSSSERRRTGRQCVVVG